MRPLIAGNWKMHKTIGEAVDFAERLKNALTGPLDRDVVIAPPFTALYPVAAALKDSLIGLAAQNLHEETEGAYTGEISGRMLVDAGCRYVIVGHSDRRNLFGEADILIGRKLQAAWSSGLIPILCIGETLKQREADLTFSVIETQINEGLNNSTADDIGKTVVAYEPVWAIGTGKTATPLQAQEVHAFIRKVLRDRYGTSVAGELRILYGGSVNPKNIGDLMTEPDINGVLVGGASLDVMSFSRIVNY